MKGKFLQLEDANIMLMQLVEEFINKAPFRGKKDTPRLSLFNNLEKPSARKIERALPMYVEHMPNLVVNKDYHVKIKGNFYSVPYIYVEKIVDVSIEEGTVKIYYKNDLIEYHAQRARRDLHAIPTRRSSDIH